MKNILLMSDSPEIGEIRVLFATLNYSLLHIKGQLSCLDNARQIQPDLILWNIAGTNFSSTQCAHLLRSHRSLQTTPLIIISDKDTYKERIQALRSGANLLISETFEPEELLAIVESTINYFERLQNRIVTHKHKVDDARVIAQSPSGFAVILTKKERQILKQVACGDHNKEIAAALHISCRTVESHITNMLNKTGLVNRTQLARWAMEHYNVPVTSKSLVNSHSMMYF